MNVKWISLLASILLISLCQISKADSRLPIPVGRVVWIKGTFKALMPNKEERLLQKASILYLHDTLVTDQNSQAEIIFTDKSLMTFRAGTTFSIDKYRFNPKGKSGGTGQYVSHLVEGGFRTITGIIAKNSPDNYQVNTPVATIGVRGTEYVTYYKDGVFYIGYYGGTPCVYAKIKNVPKNQKSEYNLCLDAQHRWGRVKGAGSKPEALSEKPDVFDEELSITPADIEPFSFPSSTTQRSSSGVVSSFCIQ